MTVWDDRNILHLDGGDGCRVVYAVNIHGTVHLIKWISFLVNHNLVTLT